LRCLDGVKPLAGSVLGLAVSGFGLKLRNAVCTVPAPEIAVRAR
jgi:hypothetical protein